MSDESFLSRWSKLKHRAKTEPDKEPAKPADETPGETQVAARPPADEAPAKATDEGDPKVIANLPSIDSLGNDSDYSPFLRPGVPEGLKMQALRRMWATDPVLSVQDPFEMHNLDWTHPVTDEVVKTAYKVGRGFLDEIEKTDADNPADLAEEETGPAPGDKPQEQAGKKSEPGTG